MKSYPHIITIGTDLIDSGDELPFDLSKEDWIGFDKLDGSLIRAKWNEAKDFHDFGRRDGMLDDSNPSLLEAPALVQRDWGFLRGVFKEFGWTRVVAYFEFYGRNSAFGAHVQEPHLTSLIDINVHPKGFVEPRELTAFDAVGGARVLHRGPITSKLIHDIANRRLKGMTFEGVVFKRVNRKGIREMFKSKSTAWYEKLREKCAGNDKLFERLK